MFNDDFKGRYTTIPFAFYKKPYSSSAGGFLFHRHKELEVIAMIEGAVDFYVDNTVFELKKGDVLIIPPYSIHRADIKENTQYNCACFDLSLLWDKELCLGLEKGALTVRDCMHSDDPAVANLNNAVKAAIEASEKKEAGWEMTVIGNLSLLLGYAKKTSLFVEAESPQPEHMFRKNVLEYVSEHYFEDITSRTLSDSLYLNNSYFCRLFKRNFGCCFADYLLKYRIEKAKLDLNNTNTPVSIIAAKHGFSDFSYFSKSFKKTVGMTPSSYRRRGSIDCLQT